MEWETVIGLEIHTQLATKSKIFSGASTAYGAAPNTQACAVDLGLPGVLPVLNEEAVHKAVIFGMAIEADMYLLIPFLPEKIIFTRIYPKVIKSVKWNCRLSARDIWILKLMG